MFKRDLYNKVIEVLNLNTQGVLFKGGYLISIYDNIPYVVDQTTESKFDYSKVEVIPVSEEVSQETPSVNLADRSDYVFQYQIMFRSKREDKVLTALTEFRDYFFANKQHTIDGYTVAFKTSRGDKQGNVPIQGGWFYSFYKISVYLTAIKDGYIYKDTDKWSLKLVTNLKDAPFVIGSKYKIVTVGTTDFTTFGAANNNIGTVFTATGVGAGNGFANLLDYETLRLDLDTFTTTGTPAFSYRGPKVVGLINYTLSNSKLRIFYNGTEMEDKIYKWIMNKLDRNTLFDFRHTFKGENFDYVGLIVGGARTRTDNGTAILEFDWIEADI